MTSRRSIARLAKTHSALAPAKTRLPAIVGSHPYLAGAAAGAVALAVTAFVNYRLAAAAERRNPPTGKFVEVDGVRLHYVEQGKGEPLVLLHGNGSMIQDFASSGLIETASKTYRVIAFDRPGYGHSERPRSTIWTAEAQAELIEAALGKIGISKATVLGHSWGCSVAVALALRSPNLVRSLVLASGYYFPSARADVVTMSGPAIPVLGDAIRYTLSPVLARLMWPLLTRKIFGPAPVPRKVRGWLPEGDDVSSLSDPRKRGGERADDPRGLRSPRRTTPNSRCPSSSSPARKTGSSISTSSRHDCIPSCPTAPSIACRVPGTWCTRRRRTRSWLPSRRLPRRMQRATPNWFSWRLDRVDPRCSSATRIARLRVGSARPNRRQGVGNSADRRREGWFCALQPA